MRSLGVTATLSAAPLVLMAGLGLRGLGYVSWTRAAWDPPMSFGALGLLLGSVVVALGGASLALYLGEGAGVQLALSGRSGRALRLLAATPGVVLAAALLGGGLGILHRLGLGLGVVLAAALLGLSAVPYVAEGMRAATLALYGGYLGALALGLSADEALGAIRLGLWSPRRRLFGLAAARLAGEAALASVLLGGAGGMPHLFSPSGGVAPTLLAELPQAPPEGPWVGALAALALALAALGALAGLFGGRPRDGPAARR